MVSHAHLECFQSFNNINNSNPRYPWSISEMATPIKDELDSEDPFSQMESLISEKLDDPIRLLKERKESLLSEVTRLRTEYSQKKQTQDQELDELRASKEEMLSIASLMKENQAQGEIMKAVKNLEVRISASAQDAVPFPEINFICDTSELSDLIPTLGEIRLRGDPEPPTPSSDPSDPTSSASTDKKPSFSFGSLGRKSGEVDNPNAICIDDANERVYVTDMGKSLIHIFSLKGEYLDVFGKGKMSAPYGIVAHEGYVYVTDFEVGNLLKFSCGEYDLVKKTNSRTPDEHLKRPYGLDACKSEIFVVESFKHRISVYSTDLSYKGTLPSGVIKKAFAISAKNKSVYVLETRTNLIKELDKQTGDVKRSIAIDKDGIHFFNANSFCFDASNTLYISNKDASFIKKIPSEAGYIQLLQTSKWGVGDVRGLAVDKENRVFVLFGKGNFCIAII